MKIVKNVRNVEQNMYFNSYFQIANNSQLQKLVFVFRDMSLCFHIFYIILSNYSAFVRIHMVRSHVSQSAGIFYFVAISAEAMFALQTFSIFVFY
jgi:hypothetical protein